MTNVSLVECNAAEHVWLLPEVLHGKDTSSPADFLALDSLLTRIDRDESLLLGPLPKAEANVKRRLCGVADHVAWTDPLASAYARQASRDEHLREMAVERSPRAATVIEPDLEAVLRL